MNTNFLILVLNCMLVQHNVRDGYLILKHDIIESTLYTINRLYSDLHTSKNSDGIIISNHKLDNTTDYTTNYNALGKLLGYPSVDQYPISRLDKLNGYYTYKIHVNLIKHKDVVLYSFVAKDLSYEKEIKALLGKITKTLKTSYLSKYIKYVYIERIYRIQINGKNMEPNDIYLII